MNAKHTPGPWLIAGEDKTFVYALGPSGTNSFWAQVQAAGAERVSDAEKAANARLIATAPELVEVLEAMAAYFGGAKDRFGRPDQSADDAMREARAMVQALAVRFGVASGHHTVTDQCAAVMRAAIAKATS